MTLRRCDAYVSSLTEQQEVQVNRNIPAVSVIIPVYNVEAYLEQCVNSVLSQSFDDFEIILVDDESPDGSGEICERYAASDTRVSVVHKKNGGLGYARNTGLEKAVGRYVFFWTRMTICLPMPWRGCMPWPLPTEPMSCTDV